MKKAFREGVYSHLMWGVIAHGLIGWLKGPNRGRKKINKLKIILVIYVFFQPNFVPIDVFFQLNSGHIDVFLETSITRISASELKIPA